MTHPTPAQFVAAAERLVGVHYRLHGRTITGGVDCVGLICCALSDCGLTPRPPRGYALRNTAIDSHLSLVAANGFVLAETPIASGDLLLVSPGPAQQHLLIACDERRFVHAHAGYRRVVRDHGLPLAPVLYRWRLSHLDKE